jgi:hypothetical protein
LCKNPLVYIYYFNQILLHTQNDTTKLMDCPTVRNWTCAKNEKEVNNQMLKEFELKNDFCGEVTNKNMGALNMKKGKKTLKVMMFMLLLVFNFTLFGQLAFAVVATPTPAGGGSLVIPGGVSNIGGSGDVTGASTDITKELDKWITNLRIIGAVVAIFGIVIGAILFSVSLGNAQRRGLAISSMLSAGGGIIIIAKAHTIAGYFIHSS